MNTNQVISFYIPQISFLYTENDIKRVFHLLNIGEVKRVDFSSVSTRKENHHSAFVHMLYLFDTDIANSILTCTNSEKPYKLWIENNVFWWILKNKNPIQDTKLNIHQIVENARLLEEKVIKQKEKINQMQDTINQLLGAVFDNKTEMERREIQIEKEYDDNESVSSDNTYSSMPSLISIGNNSDDSAQKRIQFSKDYCDNY